LLIRYRIGHDTVAAILALCDAKNLIMTGFTINQPDSDPEAASVELSIRGKTAIEPFIQDLIALPSILSVTLNPHEG
jgi:hypothetical protein